jgi:hypothetical protein
MHRSKRHLYSITSPARASTVAGISMRSDFAVLTATFRRTRSADRDRQPLIIPLRPAVFDGDVATLDETRRIEALMECRHDVQVARGQTTEESNYRQGRLLRARRKRPGSGRAAEKRDELAPLHSIDLHLALTSRS